MKKHIPSFLEFISESNIDAQLLQATAQWWDEIAKDAVKKQMTSAFCTYKFASIPSHIKDVIIKHYKEIESVKESRLNEASETREHEKNFS